MTGVEAPAGLRGRVMVFVFARGGLVDGGRVAVSVTVKLRAKSSTLPGWFFSCI